MKPTENEFQVGVGRRDISPPKPQLLKPTGMGRPHPTRGVLDPLFAEALSISLGEETAFLITADLRTFEREWLREVRARVSTHADVEPSRILFSCTHNHCSSPIPADDSAAAAAAAVEANQTIVNGIVEACCTAFDNRRSAEVAALTTQLTTTIGENRRLRLSSGLCLNGWGAGGIVPPGQRIVGPAGPDSSRVDLWCVREPGSTEPFAVLVSYATHPHMYELPAFSGEFPGAVKRILGKRLHGADILHATHACGDIDIHTVHPMPDDPEDKIAWFRRSIDLVGTRLADAVMDVLPSAHYTRPTSLRNEVFTTETEDVTSKQRIFTISGIALDDTAILSIPSELFHEHGLRIHANSPFAHLTLMGYNGTGGAYFSTPLAFEQGSYEVMRGPAPTPPDGNPFSPLPRKSAVQVETGERIVDQALEVLQKLYAK